MKCYKNQSVIRSIYILWVIVYCCTFYFSKNEREPYPSIMMPGGGPPTDISSMELPVRKTKLIVQWDNSSYSLYLNSSKSLYNYAMVFNNNLGLIPFRMPPEKPYKFIGFGPYKIAMFMERKHNDKEEIIHFLKQRIKQYFNIKHVDTLVFQEIEETLNLKTLSYNNEKVIKETKYDL